MRLKECSRCNMETNHLMLVYNHPLRQYQYEECEVCGKQALLKKIPLDEDFDLVKRRSVF